MTEVADNIILSLKSGPMSAAELARGLRVDATTVTRRLSRLGSQVVIKAGKGRATRWLLRRTLPMLSEQSVLPIYRVNDNGKAAKIALLHIVYPDDSYLVEYFRSDNDKSKVLSEWKFYESLPWWLSDMRPQGFLGRSFAKQLRSQGERLDSDPNKWSEDTTLAVLAKFPQDHVGNLLLGDVAYSRWLETPQETAINDEQAGIKADAIARGEHFDSSAKGEQPKFIATLDEGECIVKFSGRVMQTEVDSVANRWADLLNSEALAAAALNAVISDVAAHNRTFNIDGRTLLASRRFDRTPQRGRVGVISFASLDLEFVGQANGHWPEIADALNQQGVITEEAVTRCKVAWAFGQLIANSDMHLGNVSALNLGGRPYELAPVYDMLPMHYSPTSAGDLPSEPFNIRFHPNVPQICWQTAYAAAHDFWSRVIESSVISRHFKSLAEQQLKVVEDYAASIERMA